MILWSSILKKCWDRGALQFLTSIFIEIEECLPDISRQWLTGTDKAERLSNQKLTESSVDGRRSQRRPEVNPGLVADDALQRLPMTENHGFKKVTFWAVVDKNHFRSRGHGFESFHENLPCPSWFLVSYDAKGLNRHDRALANII